MNVMLVIIIVEILSCTVSSIQCRHFRQIRCRRRLSTNLGGIEIIISIIEKKGTYLNSCEEFLHFQIPSLKYYYETLGYTMKESLNAYLKSLGNWPCIICSVHVFLRIKIFIIFSQARIPRSFGIRLKTPLDKLFLTRSRN